MSTIGHARVESLLPLLIIHLLTSRLRLTMHLRGGTGHISTNSSLATALASESQMLNGKPKSLFSTSAS